MKTNEIENLVHLINKDWHDRQSHASYCVKLVNYLSQKKPTEVAHLTYSSFKSILDDEIETTVLLEILSYLSGDRANILDVHFELIDDFDNTFQLSSEDISDLMRTGVLAHPDTGIEIPSVKDKVLLYYSPSPKFNESL